MKKNVKKFGGKEKVATFAPAKRNDRDSLADVLAEVSKKWRRNLENQKSYVTLQSVSLWNWSTEKNGGSRVFGEQNRFFELLVFQEKNKENVVFINSFKELK